ncbi:hypothetical protein HNP97_000990, partial [Methanococcus maripaludis]|nr:hypothetical protein [Methanococcus maripaludis]
MLFLSSYSTKTGPFAVHFTVIGSLGSS